MTPFPLSSRASDEPPRLTQDDFQALALVLEKAIEGAEVLFLGFAQVFKLGERQSLEKFPILLDGAPEEGPATTAPAVAPVPRAGRGPDILELCHGHK
jgi:hypothetical protein